MELRQLKYFEAVARTLSFTEAARRLFVSQSTLSQQIKVLEDEIGSLLFERDTHGVRLTEAGALLLPVVRKMIQDTDLCRQQIRDIKKTLTGELNIGITFSFRDLTTEAILQFLKQYPGVKLNIYYRTSSELGEMLREGDLDFVLAFKSPRMHEDLEYETLFEYRLSAVMRSDHPLAGRASVSISDLKNYPVVLPGSGTQSRKAFDRFVSVNTDDIDVHAEINDPNVILDIVQRTSLVTILSGQVVRYRQNIVAVPVEGTEKMRGCIYTLKEAYQKRSASVFLDILRESEKINQLIQ